VDPQPILFCSHVVDWGGAETVLADLLATLDRTRFAPHLLVPGDGPLPQRARELEVTVHDLAIGGRRAITKAASIPGAVRAMRRLAKTTGARLIYANTMIAGYAGVLAQRRNLRCVWHVHVVTQSRTARLAAARAAAVVTPSRTAAAALHRADIDVIENGVPDALFNSHGTGLRSELGLDEDTPLIGIVGRIDPHKGHEVLLRACAQPAETRFHIAIAGGEALAESQARVRGYTDELRQLATQLGITDRVHFLGHRDDVPAILSQLDIPTVPSVTTESAPRTIAEAQATARPIIASDIGGIREMIRDGITGKLCPPNDPDALHQALHTLLHDDTQRRQLGQAAQEHARTHYKMQTFAHRIETVCQRTLDTIAKD